MLKVANHKRTLLHFCLPLQLIITQWITMQIQHTPPRCFKVQTLIMRKMGSPLKMPQQSMMSTSEDRNSFSADPAKEVASVVGGACRCGNKEPAILT